MGKAKKGASSSSCETRKSPRLALKPQLPPVEKKKAAAKKAPKARKGKAVENENAKAEETKAEVAEVAEAK